MKRALLLLLLAVPLAAQVDVTVVNAIPNALSNETERDAEPSIAVDPADPRRIALSAFTPDPLMSGNAPIFVSTNGGASWELRPMVPGGNVTWDVSLRFGGLSGILYGAGIPEFSSLTHVMRKPDFTSAALPAILGSGNRDQPWVEAATVMTGAAPDRVYVTAGDGAVEQSLDAATAPPPAGLTIIDVNPVTGGCTQRNAPSVRSAIHPSGRIYVAYLRWNDCSRDPASGT